MKTSLILFVLLLTHLCVATTTYTNKFGTPGTWYKLSGNTAITDDILVKSKVILVLECGIFNISANKKITVEKGGHLLILNSTLTQASDILGTSTTLTLSNNWKGIEVYGDPNEEQTDDPYICNFGTCDYTTNTAGTINAHPSYTYPLYSQGVVRIYNSKIRYSNYGVSMGTFVEPWSKGGGLLVAVRCSFENNKYHHILFGQYKYTNFSIIKDNKFKYDHLTNTGPNFYDFHSDIHFREGASLKYNIEGNEFSIYTMYNNCYGILCDLNSIKIVNNSFKNHMAGIKMNYPGFITTGPKTKYIKSNYFDQCQVGIHMGFTVVARIEDNVFIACGFDRKINGGPQFTSYFTNDPLFPSPYNSDNQKATVGIFSSSGFNMQCKGNSYTRHFTQRSLEDAFLVAFKTGSNPSSFYKNTNNRGVIGFRSCNDNTGFRVLLFVFL
jgi:hypothetical protein